MRPAEGDSMKALEIRAGGVRKGRVGDAATLAESPRSGGGIGDEPQPLPAPRSAPPSLRVLGAAAAVSTVRFGALGGQPGLRALSAVTD